MKRILPLLLLLTACSNDREREMPPSFELEASLSSRKSHKVDLPEACDSRENCFEIVENVIEEESEGSQEEPG